jgi:acetyl-CoA acetyltransferase
VSGDGARIAGLSETAAGKHDGRSTLDLVVEIAAGAIADAGLEWAAIDGLIATQPLVGAFPRHGAGLAEYLGLSAQMRFCATVTSGGASALEAVVDAVRVVEDGTCDAVLVVAADTPRTGRTRDATVEGYARMRHPDFEQPHGLTNAAAYALLARRYVDAAGADPEQLAAVAVMLRDHARGHPGAAYRDPLSVEDVLRSRLVSTPLRLLECSPVCDGGAALVVARRGRGAGGHASVSLAGHGHGYRYDHIVYAPELGETGCALSGRRALSAAGLSVDQVDVALLYDSYSVTLLIELEELGFCAPGAAAGLVASGKIGGVAGPALNTHGGLLSHGHCGGAAGMHHITEAVRQLRGTAANLVPGARVALVHGEGGIMSTHCTALLVAE